MGTVYAAGQIKEEARGNTEYYESGEWEYTIKDDGTVFIEDYNGKNADLVEIPAEIDGRTVTGFSRLWYPEDLKITTLIIPETITDIRTDIYTNPSAKLSEIIVKEGPPLYSSEDGVMYDKQKKTLVWCPSGRKGSLAVPEGVETIGENSFGYCKLSEVYLPDSLRTVENQAFIGCYYITDITIPEGVETIGKFAFDCCKGLKEIRIPEGIKILSRGMFFLCDNLSSIQLPESLITIEDNAFYDCEKLKSINLPDGLTSIEKDAFSCCKELEEVIIPTQVKSIGEYAFAFCDNLESIRIPDSVEWIGKYAFSKDTKLVIECSENSYAKECAQKRGIPYRIIKNTSGSKLGLLCNGQKVKNAQTLKVRVKKSYTL